MVDAIELRGERCVLLVHVAGEDVHVLKVGAVVANWFQAEAHELRRDVVGGDVVFDAADVAARHIVRGEEVDVGFQIRRCNQACGICRRLCGACRRCQEQQRCATHRGESFGPYRGAADHGGLLQMEFFSVQGMEISSQDLRVRRTDK
jgi:hypothetical protein